MAKLSNSSNSPKFYDKKGQLTAYALACGYTQLTDTPQLHKRLYCEHGQYHVQSLRNNVLSSIFHSRRHKFQVWGVFERISDARRLFNKLK